VKRAALAFAFFILCALSARAQTQIVSFASDPATCDPTRGLQYYNTTSQVMKYCSALNTWTAYGTGSPAAGGSPTQIQYNLGGAFSGISGTSVTSATGATTFTASADTVTPLNVFGHSGTQSRPVAIFSGDGSTHCPEASFPGKAAVCVSTDLGWAMNIIGSGPVINIKDTGSLGGGSQISDAGNQLVISGQGSDLNAAYITMGDDFAPQQSNVSIYSEKWTYFGNNGNTSWRDGINSLTGEISAGWLPDKAGQVALSGFFSEIDGALANKWSFKNPGTLGANLEWDWPSTVGTAGQALTWGGAAGTPMTWTTLFNPAIPGAIGGTTPGAGTFTTLTSATLNTATNCSSSASPAVCGSAAAGNAALPTNAVSSSIVINTTAVTANSEIFVQTDDTLGTRLGVTCNSTVATLVGGLTISARTAGTSFTVSNNVAVVTNPLCISYRIVN
jgi:hypothetical protein